MIKKVEIVGVNTSELPVLNEKEKVILLEKMKKGDESARRDFIEGNLKLVLSVLQHLNYRDEFDDLFQVGCIGLMKALDNFNPLLGTRFSTYAVPMIIGEIKRYMRDNNSVRVSRSLRVIAYKALIIKEKLTTQNSREPTVKEIAKRLNIDKEEVVFALEAIMEPASLQQSVFNDGDDSVSLVDQIRDRKCGDEHWIEKISIGEGIKKLNKKERKVLKLRFQEGRTQSQAAEEIGISQAQVSRIEKVAISRLKKYVVTEGG